jgi:hypothetical protein
MRIILKDKIKIEKAFLGTKRDCFYLFSICIRQDFTNYSFIFSSSCSLFKVNNPISPYQISGRDLNFWGPLLKVLQLLRIPLTYLIMKSQTSLLEY